MFGKILMLAALVLIAWAFVARASQGAGAAAHYTVKPGDTLWSIAVSRYAGDTLWSIAVSRYAGDPRDAIYRIDQKNHLHGSVIVPGQMLLLP